MLALPADVVTAFGTAGRRFVEARHALGASLTRLAGIYQDCAAKAIQS
jgi:hypothetical protein